MIKYLTFVLAFFAVTGGFAQKGINIKVTITRVETMNAPLIVGLYHDEVSFKAKKSAIDSVHVVPHHESVEVTFKGVARGQYAIALFQDIDGSGRLTTKEFGIPTEPVGISNYPLPGIPQPPKFRKAAIAVVHDTTIVVPLMFSKDYEKEYLDHHPAGSNKQ